MPVNDRVKKYKVAEDDLYWVCDATQDDLKELLTKPHHWVEEYCEATLADHFVVVMRTFTRDRGNGLLIQGIDKTGLVTVSTPKTSPYKLPTGFNRGEIVVAANPVAGAKRPWRAYTHLALGTNQLEITKLLMGAAGSPYRFLQKFSKNKFKWDIHADGIAFSKLVKGVIIEPRPHGSDSWSPNDSVEVVYQSHRDGGGPGGPPPACNSIVGAAYQDKNGYLVIEAEAIIVKAWV